LHLAFITVTSFAFTIITSIAFTKFNFKKLYKYILKPLPNFTFAFKILNHLTCFIGSNSSFNDSFMDCTCFNYYLLATIHA